MRDNCVVCGKPSVETRPDGESFCQNCWNEFGEDFHRCDCGAPLYGIDDAGEWECEECREHHEDEEWE